MDADQFDTLATHITTHLSRRRSLGILGAFGIASVGLVDEVAGKRKKKKKVTLCVNGQTMKVPKKKRGSYVSQGATPGACVPSGGTNICTTSAQCVGGQICLGGMCLAVCQAATDCPSDAAGQCTCEAGLCTSPTPQAITSTVGGCAACPPGTARCVVEAMGNSCFPACGKPYPCCTKFGDQCGMAFCSF